ncbi:MAG TPA: hypothetical protein PLJ27_16360 [Polyangiaceae bacterium]|nr:MAG: hypothetical protein BWY17_00505 [Deltaproteobacteria bacterium ADurb.Bin207]HNS97083.1 hypothetical protein [Polyangiaceae bacterium]HNZ20871.1 hypothetical protein [Polyangiaceae bacterium]HOD21444.1 hypothetical protein [Polyangiaceae bacterium]HOE47552.1 hypothetical protein [Polyangiaceae bacterium]
MTTTDSGPSASLDSLAQRFSPSMNAVTSPYGILCDLTFTFAVVAAVGISTAAVFHYFPAIPGWVAIIPLAIPFLINAAAHLALCGARHRVVNWLMGVPFPVENVNAVLCGVGEQFDVTFEEAVPSRDALMQYLARASEDAYVLEIDESRRAMLARFGVVESKHNPHREAHRRFKRMQKVVSLALIPMHEEHRIERVLIV